MNNHLLSIAFTGPESTGKTSIAEKIASDLKLPLIQDYSRSYFSIEQENYEAEDILAIAELIILSINKVKQVQTPIFLLDSELINLKIWLEYYEWTVPNWLQLAIKHNIHDLYLLMNTDIPWVGDSLRKNEHDREKLFRIFEDNLLQYKCNYKIITGVKEERISNCISEITSLISGIIK